MKAHKGIEMWNKSKKIIPGGSQLLSKRSEQFLPDQWPSYYNKAKGIEIWDLDNNKFLDMSLMGVGSCILGYADEDVNHGVLNAVNSGSMTTLNCPEEVELAEILLKLNSWAGMIRYARTGGEAMAVAVRIARAHTGKDKVAFCGYHGWHDWYLSANLADCENLDEHLLPGLEPKGVPSVLKGTSIPFHYNKIDELEDIVTNNDIGTIVVEPVRHNAPKDNFLNKVRAIADEQDAVLVFDEITSGWRMNVGGIHELYDVYPDIAVYGKALGNGFPISAIVGKEEIMDSCQTSFISSTYWTDRIGPVAAITTINKLIEKNVPQKLCKTGLRIGEEWNIIADELDLKIDVLDGIPSLIAFTLNYGTINQALITLFRQEMLDRGYLASNGVYVSYAHEKSYVDDYLENVYDSFSLLKRAVDEDNVFDLLKGPVAHSGFKRLN